EGGITLDGTLLQQNLGNPQSRTVSEGSATAGPIVHNFSGIWLTPGGITASAGVIAFQEGSIPVSQGVSDILTFTFSNTTFQGLAAAQLVGTFDADFDPVLLPLAAGATVVAEGTAFVFDKPFLTASALSDVDAAVPEPATLTLLGSALLGFGFLRFRRR